MSLQITQDDFIQQLSEIYDTGEAKNIWLLVMERITGNRQLKSQGSKTPLTNEQEQTLKKILDRLQHNEPIQYILNESWFYDIPFYVDKNVLIPRPETEELTDWIIKENKTCKTCTILDIGTGSGCIPIILKRKIPAAKIFGCDISEAALKVAEKNAATYQTTISFLQADFLNKNIFDIFPDIDIIVSNPPYIPQKDKKHMRANVLNFEPHLALFVDNHTALIFYDAIARFGLKKLNPTGKIYVEIHESLGKQTTALFESHGYTTTLKKDMQGKDRMVKAALNRD
ncbi:MAG: peptide chain release factor N(5)-glutamine methyltransferase [Niabella sp.]